MQVRKALLACLVSLACQDCLVSLEWMGLKELLAQLEEKGVQELWDFKVKKVRNSWMAFAAEGLRRKFWDVCVWYYSSKHCNLLFFNTLACLPKSTNEFASGDVEVPFFSARLFCKKISWLFIFISSGDRGDIGPPGLPVLGTSEQALQIKGDKGDPGLAGLGGFPGPRGISQHCSLLPVSVFSIWACYQWSMVCPFGSAHSVTVFSSAIPILARLPYGSSGFWENSFPLEFCSVDLMPLLLPL